LGGIGRPDARLSALAFDRADQRGFLAADERAGAQADFQIKIESRSEDVFAQQSPLAALVDGALDPLDGHWIFGADVEKSLMGAEGESGDDHALDDVQRIAFQHAPVHERAGVALVGVADQVADRIVGRGAHFPFLPGRKPAAAPAAKV